MRHIMLTQATAVFGPELPKGACFPVGSPINGTFLDEDMADEMVKSGHAVDVEIVEVE